MPARSFLSKLKGAEMKPIDVQEINSNLEKLVNEMDFETVRKAVIEYLHWNGDCRHRLTVKQWEDLYLTMDGFGNVRREILVANCWDWSHVRDSSEKAFRRAWTIICIWHNEKLLLPQRKAKANCEA